MSFRLLGIGSPLIDRSARVPEEFLATVGGGKGGTRHVTGTELAALLRKLPRAVHTVAGGAAANTMMAAAELGLSSALLGKLGADEDGAFFRRSLLTSGADDSELRTDPEAGTGCCLVLITPDAERTMRSDLGASTRLTAEETAQCDFSRYDWVLFEGYFVNAGYFEPTLRIAREAGARVAVDLCSCELAARERERFTTLLERYADLVFANRDEAEALTGLSDPEAIASKICGGRRTAAVKLGACGSLVATPDGMTAVPPAPVKQAVDTTAAGDFYAAGFFYGLSKGLPPEKCGYAGSLTAAAIVQRTGTKLDREEWKQLKSKLENL